MSNRAEAGVKGEQVGGMLGLSTHAKGIVITAAGVLAITPDTLLIRLISADPWTLLACRSLLMGLAMTLGLAVYHRRGTLACFRSIGRRGILLSLLLALAGLLFVMAVAHTSVANTLIIMCAAPLFAAIMSHLFLKEPVAPRTWIAVILALFGVAIIVWGSLGGGPGGVHLLGDLLALGASAALAGSFTMIRGSRAINMIPAAALSGLFAGLAALPLASPLSLAPSDVGYLLLMGLVMLPVSFALTTLGPRYLPAPEVSLLMLLETFLGPLWVWLVLREEPSPQALIGGTVIVTVLVVHSAVALRRTQAATA